MLILKMGSLMSLGYEKTILLYNAATYEMADIISSYIYRVELIDQDWSYSTAIGLFNSTINCILVAGVFLDIIMTSLGAYFLSGKNVMFQRPIMMLIMFIMFFPAEEKGRWEPKYKNGAMGLYSWSANMYSGDQP